MLAAALVGFRMLGPFGGILGILSVPSALRWWRARGRRRATEEAEEELREICLALAAALRAGLSLRLSLEEAIRDAGPSLREPFRAVLARLSVGEPMAAALTTLLEVTDVPDVRLVASVLELHGRTGGELPGLLDEAAAALGRRIESRRQVRALTAQGRASGAVLALLPVVFVGLLTIGGGDGLGAFYRTPQGSLLLGLGLVLDGLGFLWIRRLLRTRGGA
jgi:tight adherence protein B